MPFLVCGSDTDSFALCLAMCFYDHRGLLRASAATAMPFCRRRYKHRRFSLCGMHCTACACDISSDGRRVVFLRRFLTCFACFMQTITGKTAFRWFSLFFSHYLAKLSAILLFGVSDTVRYMRLCGPTAGSTDAVVMNLRRLQRHLCIVLLPNKNAGRIRCQV